MRLKLKCGNCGRNIQVEGEEIPRMAWMECPNCRSKFQTPSNILSVDDEIAGFKVVRHLGSGAMGCVYLATQLSMQRQIALKVLPPELTHNEEEITEFIREVRLLAKLDHPSIVKALEAGKDPDSDNYFLAMNFVDGRSLEEEIEHKGPFTEKQSLKLALKLADALDHAWRRHEILHRDIKPSNIMLRDATHPVLLDMGISKIHGTQTGRTTHGMMLGTPHYMSPEQARDSSNVDFRTDIYALGCTMFYMLTGKVPYDAPDILGVVSKHAFDDVPSPRDHNPAVSSRCVNLLQRMMAKKPEDRYASWHDVVTDIKQTLAGSTSSAVRGPKTRERHSRQSNPLASAKTKGANTVFWAAAFFVLLLLSILAFLAAQIIRDKEVNDAADFQPPTVIVKEPAPKPKSARMKEKPPKEKPVSRKPATPRRAVGSTSLPDLGTDDFTISMWLKRDSNYGQIISCDVPDKQLRGARHLILSNGRVWYHNEEGQWLKTELVLDKGKWYHVALVGSSPAMLYVNSRLLGRSNNPKVPLPQGAMLKIGSMGKGRFGSPRIYLDSLRFYRRRMTKDEIRSDMEQGKSKKGLVGFYTLNNNARDESGCGNHLEIRGKGKHVRGKLNNCIFLNKEVELVYPRRFGRGETTTDRRDPVAEPGKDGVGGAESLLDLGKDPYTVAVWIRPRSATGAVWGKSHPKEWTRHSKWFGINGGGFCTYMKGLKTIKTKTPVRPDNKWVHLAATYSGTTLRLYVNGRKEGEGEVRNAPDPTDSVFRIGHRQKASIKPLVGDIDSMHVYRTCLSESEVQKDMANSKPISGKPLAACWDFEGNWKDGSGHGNELTGKGPFDFIPDGKHGKALRVKGWCDIMLKKDAGRLWR